MVNRREFLLGAMAAGGSTIGARAAARLTTPCTQTKYLPAARGGSRQSCDRDPGHVRGGK